MKVGNSRFILAISFVIIGLVVAVSFSYAYIIKFKVASSKVVVATGNFGGSISSTELPTSYNLTAMSDYDGMDQNNYATVIVNETGNDYDTYFQIGLGYNQSAFPSGTTVDDLMPLEFVRLAIYSMNGNTLSSDPIAGPFSITDMPMLTVDPSNFLNDTYRVYWDFADEGTSSKFAIKFWLDELTPLDYNGALVYLGTTIKEEAKRSVDLIDLSGTVDFFDGETPDYVSIDGRIPVEYNSIFNIDNIPVGLHVLRAHYSGDYYGLESRIGLSPNPINSEYIDTGLVLLNTDLFLEAGEFECNHDSIDLMGIYMINNFAHAQDMAYSTNLTVSEVLYAYNSPYYTSLSGGHLSAAVYTVESLTECVIAPSLTGESSSFHSAYVFESTFDVDSNGQIPFQPFNPGLDNI